MYQNRLMLQNLNPLDGVLLDLAEADGKHAIFQDGFDVLFLHGNRQCDATRELAPVTFLQEVILDIIFVSGGQSAADRQRVVGNAYIQLTLVYTGSSCLDYKTLFGLIDINSELTR